MKPSIEHIRELNPIEKIAGEYTKLKAMGEVLRGKCPLPAHQETEPSFTVYPDSQSFYCFGCRRGGDVFNLVMYREGFDFLEAVRFLAAKANIPDEELSEELIALVKESRAIEDALTLAVEYYRQLLIAEETSAVVEVGEELHTEGTVQL